MAPVAIQKHGYLPAAILSVHLKQERLEVLCTLMAPDLEQAMARRQIHTSEYHAAGIPSA
jgi:hypothetical protein